MRFPTGAVSPISGFPRFPDGGIARLRVFGHVVADPRPFDGLTIDLASQDHGGQVVTSSDGFYTSAAMLNRPDKGRNMGDGWETRAPPR